MHGGVSSTCVAVQAHHASKLCLPCSTYTGFYPGPEHHMLVFMFIVHPCSALRKVYVQQRHKLKYKHMLKRSTEVALEIQGAEHLPSIP